MKKTLLPLSVFLALALSAFCRADITFKVEELTKPTEKLSTSPIQPIYEELIRLDAGTEYLRTTDKIDYHYDIIAMSKTKGALVDLGYHPFFTGMYRAYANHRPFVLSPDMIWLLISQGFAQHVNANSENLRNRFVDFSGKLSLVVATETVTLDNPNSPWEEIFPQFTEQIAEHTGDKLMNALTSDFSTTTPVERIASQITIMEAMKSYFEFIVLRCVCGIPEITLKGTPEDWQRILDKTRQLSDYDLTWWTSELEPVLQEFVNASKGNINQNFWRNMFKRHTAQQYGQINADGWIVKFFPYDKFGKRNNLKEITNADILPNEIVKVDVKYIDLVTKITTPLEFWAGFIGLEQNDNDYALTPKIGWMIRKKDVSNDALRQTIARDIKSGEDGDGGVVHIRVKEVPEALFEAGEIPSLMIEFIGKVDIPDGLAKVKIGEMTLVGEIDEAGKDRIKKLFPNTKVSFFKDLRELYAPPPPPPPPEDAK